MITCFGSLNVDMIFQMDFALDSGQTLIANSFRIEAGGKGGNQAVAAASAGASVGAEKCDLDTLFSQSDLISVHAPSSKETRHMVNADRLGKAKSNMILINTSRGP